MNISKKILKTVGKTNGEFNLIGDGDKIVLGLSGGKDSITLAHVLKHIQRHAPFNFEFKAVTVAYSSDENWDFLKEHTEKYEIPHEIYQTEILDIAEDKIRKNSSYCSFFSRMRRGALYSATQKMGFNKLALGHHFDDAVESYFMNLFYNSTMRSLAPKYTAGNGLVVIRPLIQIRERQLIDAVVKNSIMVVGDETCPSNRYDVKTPYARAKMKSMLFNLEQEFPTLFNSMNNAFRNFHLDSFFLDEENLAKFEDIKTRK
jgi:tRNA(Ile)-lysidine synthase TilS/MesJ